MCHRRCSLAGVSFSMLSPGWCVCQQDVEQSAERAEPSETPWHTHDGTPTTAWYKLQPPFDSHPFEIRIGWSRTSDLPDSYFAHPVYYMGMCVRFLKLGSGKIGPASRVWAFEGYCHRPWRCSGGYLSYIELLILNDVLNHIILLLRHHMMHLPKFECSPRSETARLWMHED